MSLRLQIETIIFSCLFGFLAFFIRMLFYKQIYNKNKFIKIIFSFIYIEMLTLIYKRRYSDEKQYYKTHS